MVKIISLGGSIVAPDSVDVAFIKKLKSTLYDFLNKGDDNKLILIIGGGAPARVYQKAYRDICDNADNNEQDWIGIQATKLNARLLKAVFKEECVEDVVHDPTNVPSFNGRVLVASGWKPGFSTDFDAVVLAERFKADTVINLSNIEKVYTDDPKINPEAKPIDEINWADFRKIVGDEWVPGKNLPFDPVAAKRASELHLKVICAAGRNIENIIQILNDNSFEGTIIGPD